MMLILIIILIVVAIGGFRSWGPYPSGGIGLVVFILLILFLMGRL